MRRPDAEQGVVLRAADDGDDGLRRGGLQDRRAVPRQGRKDPQPPTPPSGELIVYVFTLVKLDMILSDHIFSIIDHFIHRHSSLHTHFRAKFGHSFLLK